MREIDCCLCVTTLAGARLNQTPSFERAEQTAWHCTVRRTLDLSSCIHFHIHQPSPFSAFHLELTDVEGSIRRSSAVVYSTGEGMCRGATRNAVTGKEYNELSKTGNRHENRHRHLELQLNDLKIKDQCHEKMRSRVLHLILLNLMVNLSI